MSNQFNVILDLDQTLISSEAEEEFNAEKTREFNKEKAKKFKSTNMEDYYVVFERPGLQKFLTFLFANFNVSVWTAASKDYALFIIEQIIINGKSNRKLDWIFFSYHCDISKHLKAGTKDLNILWDEYNLSGYTRSNTIIIDDYDEVYNTQKGNCILAEPFEFTRKGSENDDFLNKLKPLLVDMKKNMRSTESPAIKVNEALS